MSHLKRPLDGQDPDYEHNTSHEAKRLRILERNAKAEFSHKASIIIQEEFNKELANKEKEVFEIEERLHQAQKTLHLLRYAIISAFYNKKQIQGTSNADDKHQRIHPAVKKLIGKQPPKWEPLQQRPSKYRQLASTSNNMDWAQGSADTSKATIDMSDTAPSTSGSIADTPARADILGDTKHGPSDTSSKQLEAKETVTKVPRYIPPKTGPKSVPVYPVNDRRGMRHKVKKRLVIGNISKWVPVDTREDAASHKWMMYVRGPKESPDISDFVSKVRFFLHPSYRPHDIAEVTSPPFHLSKRGWGEFPVRVQIHFCHPRNKPVDVIHHLKLDRTYTGLQTLGAETVVDIWLYTGPQENGHVEEETSIEVLGANKLCNEVKNSSSQGNLNSESSTSTATVIAHTSNTNEDSARTASPITPKVEPEMDSNSQTVNESVCDSALSVPCAVSLDHDYIGSMSVMNTLGDSGFYSERSGESETSTSGHPSQNSEESEKTKLSTDLLEPQLLENVENVLEAKENMSYLKEKSKCKESINSEVSKSCSAAVKQVDVEDSTTQKDEKTPKKISSFSRHSATSLLNNQTAVEGSNNVGTTKLTTLVKCMDKSGNVFYITLGRANVKQQVKPGNVSQQKAGLPQESTSPGKPPPLLGATSLLIPKDKQPKQEQQLELTNTLLRNAPATVVNNSTSVLLPRVDTKSLLSRKVTSTIPSQVSGKKTLLNNSNLFTPKQKQLFQSTNIPINVSATTSSDSGSTTSKLIQGAVANVKMVPANQLLIGSNLRQTCLVSKTQPEKQLISSASQEKKITNVQMQQATTEEQRTLIIKDGQFYILKNPQVSSTNLSKQTQSISESTKRMYKSTVTLENSRHLQVPIETSSIALSKPQAPHIVSVNSVIPTETATNVIKVVNNTSTINNVRKAILPGTSGLSQTIKSGSSLLKKSVHSTNVTPAPAKLEVKEEKSLKLKNKEDPKFILSGRTLVLNKTNSKHVGGSRKLQFEEQLRNAVTKCRFPDMSKCVRWLLRHMPLVTPLACVPEYKVIHPYAAPDRKTFLQWNIGKRRAAEWCRAKAVQKALLSCGEHKETKVWSTHAIAVWAKLHGYTPLSLPNKKETSQNQELQKEIKQQPLPTTYSEPVKIMDWLVSTNHNSDLNSSIETDMEVDIISIDLPEHKVPVVKEETTVKTEELNSEALILEINSPDMEAECFHVRETARELGFRLVPEEIIPGVLYGAAERVIVEAVRSLVDDLLRRSLCKAMKRNSNSYPETLPVEDIKAALLSRSEFDIFTNSGLGVQVTDTS